VIDFISGLRVQSQAEWSKFKNVEQLLILFMLIVLGNDNDANFEFCTKASTSTLRLAAPLALAQLWPDSGILEADAHYVAEGNNVDWYAFVADKMP
jgi:hypothetical protein